MERGERLSNWKYLHYFEFVSDTYVDRRVKAESCNYAGVALAKQTLNKLEFGEKPKHDFYKNKFLCNAKSGKMLYILYLIKTHILNKSTYNTFTKGLGYAPSVKQSVEWKG